MELEKIRQSDVEVRWQHDEDVSECNSCKKTFQNRKEKVSFFFFGFYSLQTQAILEMVKNNLTL